MGDSDGTGGTRGLRGRGSGVAVVLFLVAAAVVVAAAFLGRRAGDPRVDGGFFEGSWPDTGPVALGFWETDGRIEGLLNREVSDDGDPVAGIRLGPHSALLVVHRWVEAEDEPVGVARLWVHWDGGVGDLRVEREDTAVGRRRTAVFRRRAGVRECRASLSMRIGAYGHRSTFRFPYPDPDGDGAEAPLARSLGESVRECRNGFMGGLSDVWDGIRNPGYSGNEWELLATPQLRRLEPDLVSVLVRTYPYRGGNGNWMRYATWTRVTDGGVARPLRLAELFREDGRWVRYLRTACALELARLDAAWPGDATAETTEDGKPNLPAPLEEDLFTLSSTGLQLHFDPYEAGSGAQGGFVVHVPFSDLRPYLRPEWRERLEGRGSARGPAAR